MGILHLPAAFFCTAAHESIQQKRKYGDRRYYTHPLTVATLVHTLPDADEHMVAAACLHDIIEDVSPKNAYFSPDWLLNEFGNDVYFLVRDLTNEFTKDKYPEMNRNARKAEEAKRIATISDRAKAIKRADLYHNSTEISPDARFWQQWLKEKAELDALIGKWEDHADAFITGGDVWLPVGSGEFNMLVSTAAEFDAFYGVVEERFRQAVFYA